MRTKRVLVGCCLVLSLNGFLGSAQASDRGVAASAEEIHPLLVGQSIPAVQIKSTDGKLVDLKNLVSKKSTVIVFYRGGWCPYCNLQLKDLKLVEPEILRLGYQILAISADRTEELLKSREKHGLNYSLFSDSTTAAARAFGLAFKVDDSTLEKYKTFGINLEKASGESHHILPTPAVFIVGIDGEIKFEYINPNYKVRLKSEILISAARAYSPATK